MIRYIAAFFITILTLSLIVKDRIYINDTIVLGTSIPKTGIMKEWGRSVEVGTNAYFKYVNEKKLLPNGQRIKLISLDDKYEPDLTYINTKKLLEKENLFALYGYVGTPTVKNILPLLEDNKLPFVAPFTGASFLRNSNNENFVNFRSSYKEEIEKIVNYLYDTKGIRKFSVFYQNDNYGEEGYISLIQALEEKNLKLHGEGTYKRNTLSIKHAFAEIKNSEPEAVIMVGSYHANAVFINRAKEDDKLKNAFFCNISFSDANEMIKNLNYENKNLLFSQVVPSYNNYRMDIIKEYKYLMRKYYPNEDLGFISLESYLAAKVVVKAINNIKGFLTYSKFLEELKKLPKDTLRGLDIGYKNTQILNKVYLFKYADSKFVEIINEKKQ